jgi:acyl-CoA thioesterase-1
MRIVHRLLIVVLFGLIPALATASGKPGTSTNTSPKTILVVGDSLSAEYGLERGSGWVEKLRETLQQTRPEYQIQNASISGDTTSGGVSRLPKALADAKPAIVIIELGANDALRGLSLDMTRANLNRMAELCREAGANVLLVGMQIPPNYGRTYTEQFRMLFAQVANQNKTGLVPFLLEGIATDTSYFQSDGIHPNEQAQPKLAKNVWAYLEPLLQR